MLKVLRKVAPPNTVSEEQWVAVEHFFALTSSGNRLFALLLRLVNEIDEPTWDFDQQHPDPLHDVREYLLPCLLAAWADTAAAPLILSGRYEDAAVPLVESDSLVFCERGTLQEVNLPLLLALLSDLLGKIPSYVVLPQSSSLPDLQQSLLTSQLNIVLFAELGHESARCCLGAVAGEDVEHSDELADAVSELARLKFGASLDEVNAEYEYQARDRVGSEGLFGQDWSWANELLARCPIPYVFAEQLSEKLLATRKAPTAAEFVEYCSLFLPRPLESSRTGAGELDVIRDGANVKIQH
jgi:hypothetical protein